MLNMLTNDGKAVLLLLLLLLSAAAVGLLDPEAPERESADVVCGRAVEVRDPVGAVVLFEDGTREDLSLRLELGEEFCMSTWGRP